MGFNSGFKGLNAGEYLGGTRGAADPGGKIRAK